MPIRGSTRCAVRFISGIKGINERNEQIYIYSHSCFLPLLGDELQLPKVMTDTDTVASVSTDAGVLKRARSRHYLNGKSRRVNIHIVYVYGKEVGSKVSRLRIAVFHWKLLCEAVTVDGNFRTILTHKLRLDMDQQHTHRNTHPVSISCSANGGLSLRAICSVLLYV